MLGLNWKKKDKKETPAKEEPKKAAPKEEAIKPAKKEASVETETLEGLKVKVKERQPCLVTLSIQVPAETLEEAAEDALRNIQGRAKLPGFRPGKAPMDMVKKTFEGHAREEALDKTLRRSVYEALQDQKIVAVATPVVDKIEYAPGKPLKFEMKVESAPEIDLKDYKGLSLEKKTKAVADADVDKKVEELREANAKLVVSTADAVGDAHYVVVDYHGTVDGRPLEGGDAKEQLIDMASPQTIAGFTDGILGAKKGETKEVKVTFPADYFKKDIAGKDAVFQITVHEIKEKQLPVLDDDFAKDLSLESLAALRDILRKNMETEQERAQRQFLIKQVSDQLVEKHPIDLPPSMVEERVKTLNERLKQYLTRQGASEEDWKTNADKMAVKNKAEAERQLRLSYVLSEIAKAEKLDVTDAEIDEQVKKSVETIEPARRNEMAKWMASQRDGLYSQILEEKIFNFLIKEAKVKEAPAA